MILCSLQATERLPRNKRTDFGIDLEMRQHPIKCLVCGVHFHLPILTNDQNLLLGFCLFLLGLFGNCLFCAVLTFSYLIFSYVHGSASVWFYINRSEPLPGYSSLTIPELGCGMRLLLSTSKPSLLRSNPQWRLRIWSLARASCSRVRMVAARTWAMPSSCLSSDNG